MAQTSKAGVTHRMGRGVAVVRGHPRLVERWGPQNGKKGVGISHLSRGHSLFDFFLTSRFPASQSSFVLHHFVKNKTPPHTLRTHPQGLSLDCTVLRGGFTVSHGPPLVSELLLLLSLPRDRESCEKILISPKNRSGFEVFHDFNPDSLIVTLSVPVSNILGHLQLVETGSHLILTSSSLPSVLFHLYTLSLRPRV